MTITTDTRTDVNAAFATERTAQVGRVEYLRSEAGAAEYIAEQTKNFDARVAKGELVKLSEGRYQSTAGWDRGEVWEVRSVNGQSLVLPEHGLDIDAVTGKARLFSAVPAWHGLGQVIPGGITSIDDVIKLGQLNVPAVSIPVPDYQLPGVPGTFKAPGQFIIANGSTGEFWGMVGKVHKNIDVRASFEFMENLAGEGVVWESAGLMGNGRRVFISARVPGGIVIDAEGVNDYTDLFLVVQDARDGSAAYKAMVTPWRPLCQNTNRFALRDAVSSVSLRHTSGLTGRIEKTRLTLGMSLKYAEQFAAEGTVLARTAIKAGEFEQLMAELSAEGKKDGELSGRVFGARDKAEETTRTAKANDRAEDDLMERFAVESGRVGPTLYAAEQAYTGRLDWGMTRKGDSAASRWQARIEASLAGADDLAKTRAHAKLLMVATNR